MGVENLAPHCVLNPKPSKTKVPYFASDMIAFLVSATIYTTETAEVTREENVHWCTQKGGGG